MTRANSPITTAARIILLSLAFALLAWQGTGHLLVNWGSVTSVRAALHDGERASAAERLLGGAERLGRSNALWARSWLAFYAGRLNESQTLLKQLLRHEPDRLTLARELYPEDRALARWALNEFPEASLPAFWLGELVRSEDPEQAIGLYERALTLNPLLGVRWVELAQMNRSLGRIDEALHAFQMACTLADRGGNGCWQGGQLAEEHGQLELARELYRKTIEQVPGFARAYERLEAVSE